MKNRLLGNIFSSGLQAFAIQVLGVVFFLVISLYLSKEEFGIINWANALAVLITGLLSFGLDQVVVRRIAATATSSDWAAAAYFFHAFIGSVVVFAALFVLSLILGGDPKMQYLPWFFLVQAVIYIATPLKLFLNAKQIFAPYGIIASVSNLCKVALGFFLYMKGALSVTGVFFIMLICSLLELAGLIFYISRKTDLKFRFRKTAYTKLLKESLPQYLSVIFDSSLSRVDWILLGIISTNAITAEYSLAYKAYEVGKLPVVVIAPIILAKFARTLSPVNSLTTEKQYEIGQLFAAEAFFAMMLPVAANILWSPVLDWVFNGKYGSVNAVEFMLLSLCLPLQFLINLLWTLAFASKKYKQVSIITLVSACSNIVLNIILIPILAAKGAAIAFLITNILQAGFYYYYIRKSAINISLKPFIIMSVFALIAFAIAKWLDVNVVLQLVFGLIIYISLAFVTRQVSPEHFRGAKNLLSR